MLWWSIADARAEHRGWSAGASRKVFSRPATPPLSAILPAVTDPSPGGLRQGLRALVRQLATAVYALVAFSLFARLLPTSAWAMVAAEVLTVFAAAAILARLVEGPWWTVGLVGPLVALLDLTVLLLGSLEGPAAVLDWRLLFVVLPPVAGGLAGTWISRRLRPGRVSDAPAP